MYMHRKFIIFGSLGMSCSINRAIAIPSLLVMKFVLVNEQHLYNDVIMNYVKMI